MTFLLFLILIVLLSATIGLPLVFLLELIGWQLTGVPYVPIPKHALNKLPDVLELSDESVVYDLGSGDGRVIYTLAKNAPGRYVGIEKAPFPFLASKVRGAFQGRANTTTRFADIFTTPLSDATHIVTYLSTDVMEKLLPKFERELRPGTRVVSCDFQFPGRIPTRTIPLPSSGRGAQLVVYDF